MLTTPWRWQWRRHTQRHRQTKRQEKTFKKKVFIVTRPEGVHQSFALLISEFCITYFVLVSLGSNWIGTALTDAWPQAREDTHNSRSVIPTKEQCKIIDKKVTLGSINCLLQDHDTPGLGDLVIWLTWKWRILYVLDCWAWTNQHSVQLATKSVSDSLQWPYLSTLDRHSSPSLQR